MTMHNAIHPKSNVVRLFLLRKDGEEDFYEYKCIKVKIDKSQWQSKYRMCGEKDETVNHLISECSSSNTERVQEKARLGR